MNLRKQLSSYIALNNYVEAIRSSQLPTGYTELEYIESTGTQYIDTGIVNWNNTLEYEIKLSIEPQSGIKTYYGCYDEWSTSKNNVPHISSLPLFYLFRTPNDHDFVIINVIWRTHIVHAKKIYGVGVVRREISFKTP